MQRGRNKMKHTKKYSQELLEWSWNQLRFRKKYKNTPAGFLDSEMEKNAVSKWKNDVQKFRQDQEYRILSENFDFSGDIFVGRKRELSLIQEKLAQSDGPVILYGMGGIGKSALVRAYIRNFGANYDHVLFLTFQSSMQSLITDDFGIQISNLQYRAEQYGSLHRYFNIKYDILCQIAQKKHILLVIDDCNIKKDKNMQKVFSLPCRILVTTRRNPVIWGDYEGLFVQELKGEDEWTEFIESYRTKEFTPEELTHILCYRDRVQGHTLMMQQKIHNPGKDFRGISDFKKGLFQRFSLKKEEKQAMTYLSIMPVQGIPRKMFRLISQISDETVKCLEDNLFVQTAWSDNWNDELLYLHPIIAESARLIFCPSPENCGQLIMGMKDYLRGLSANEPDTWNRTVLENRRLEVYVFAFMKAFPSPAPWLAEAFDELATFLWIQKYFKEAKSYILKTYKAVEQYYGSKHQMTGQIALRVAAVYYNALEFEEAKKWYWNGYEILRCCPPWNQLYAFFQSSALHKIARMFRYEDRLTEGLNFSEASIKYIEDFLSQNSDVPESIWNRYKRMLIPCLLEKGKILLCMGRIEEAEQICEKIYREMPPSMAQRFQPNEFQDFRIELLMRRRDYKKAEILLLENVERAMHYRGEAFKDTLSCMERLGNVYLIQGKEKEALKVYEHIIVCIQRDYPCQTKWLNRIAKKMETLG